MILRGGVLFRKRELTEFLGKLGEFCEFALHTNDRLRGTHLVLSPELGEGKKAELGF